MKDQRVSVTGGPPSDVERVRNFYQNTAVAGSYDRERFSTWTGRTFNTLERTAFCRALAQATEEVAVPSILDAPCGTGRATEWLLQRGFHVTAGDIAAPMLALAATRCAAYNDRVRFLLLDLEHLALTDAAFDIATCIRLFHHLPTGNRATILHELARVARRFVIANVSLSSPYYRLRRHVKQALHQGISRQSSSWEEIQAEARQAGLLVERLHFVARWASEDVVIVFRKVKPS